MKKRSFVVAAALVATSRVLGQGPSTPAKPDVRVTDPNGTSLFDALSLKPPRTAVAAMGKRYALLVGVRQAEVMGAKQHELPVCPADAVAMGAALQAAGYDCTIVNDDPKNESRQETRGIALPTVSNVQLAVKEVCAKAGPDDQVLVYFSTHGIILPGAKEGRGDGPAILALRDGALDIAEVKAALAGSRALTKLLLLDCCRDNKKFSPKVSEFRDIHVITACRPDEVSKTGPRGLSLFTEAFVAGLTDCRADRFKDGQIELDELLNYTIAEVPRLVEQMEPGAKQNPTRSVVDPRMVNPIVASCTERRVGLDELVPTAMSGPVQTLPRDDLVLSAALSGKIALGMSEEEVTRGVGRPADDPAGCEKDAKGEGLAMYFNLPGKGDTSFVFYEGCKVTRVITMYSKLCEGNFDAAKSRAMLKTLLNGRDLTEISDALGSPPPTMQQLFEKLGCPSSGLMTDTDVGTVYYDDVPLPGQRLRFGVKGGRVHAVELESRTDWRK